MSMNIGALDFGKKPQQIKFGGNEETSGALGKLDKPKKEPMFNFGAGRPEATETTGTLASQGMLNICA